jgi:hypothetical protein
MHPFHKEDTLIHRRRDSAEVVTNEVLLGSTLPSRTTYQSVKETYRLSVIP